MDRQRQDTADMDKLKQLMLEGSWNFGNFSDEESLGVTDNFENNLSRFMVEITAKHKIDLGKILIAATKAGRAGDGDDLEFKAKIIMTLQILRLGPQKHGIEFQRYLNMADETKAKMVSDSKLGTVKQEAEPNTTAAAQVEAGYSMHKSGMTAVENKGNAGIETLAEVVKKVDLSAPIDEEDIALFAAAARVFDKLESRKKNRGDLTGDLQFDSDMESISKGLDDETKAFVDAKVERYQNPDPKKRGSPSGFNLAIRYWAEVMEREPSAPVEQ